MKIRRLLAIVLVLVMSIGIGVADDPYIDMNGNLMKYFTENTEYSAADWIGNEEDRCYLTAIAILDWLMERPNGDSYIVQDMEPTYIGKKGLDLVIMFEVTKDSEANTVFIIYRVVTNECGYGFIYGDTPYNLESYMTELCTDGLFKNDAETFYKCNNELLEAFGIKQ